MDTKLHASLRYFGAATLMHRRAVNGQNAGGAEVCNYCEFLPQLPSLGFRSGADPGEGGKEPSSDFRPLAKNLVILRYNTTSRSASRVQPQF